KLNLVNKATLEIEGDFKPSTEYTITFNANPDIKDGFGLPLQHSQISFKTKAFPSVLKVPRNFITFPSFKGSWKVIAGGFDKEPPHVTNFIHCSKATFVNVNSQNLIQILQNQDIGSADYQIEVGLTSKLEISDIDADKLFGKSGLFLVERSCTSYNRPEKIRNFVQRTNFGVSAISTSSQIFFWVTRLNDNTNVENAKISIYYQQYNYVSKTTNVELLGTTQTSHDGIARFETSKAARLGSMIAIINV